MTTTLPALILQLRDFAVLAALGENGFMDTDLIRTQHFNDVSDRRCRQRLSQYQQHGLTRATTIKLWTSDSSPRAPTIHCLTEKAIEIVQSHFGNVTLRVSKGDPQPGTIHHRLQIVRTKLVLDAACKTHNLAAPQWVLEQDRDPHASMDLPPNQRRLLYHSFFDPPRCTCQPDAACRFVVPRDPTKPQAGTSDIIGLFEVDCSTEGRKQIAAKLPGYTRLISARAFQRYFPQSDKAVVRVFWICQTWARIDSLCEKIASDPVAQFFRFTALDDLTPSQALTSPIWYATDGKRREIIRLPAP